MKPEPKPEPPAIASHPPQKPSAPIPKKKAPPKKAPPTAPSPETAVKTAPKPDPPADPPVDNPPANPVSGYSVAPQAFETGQSSAYSTMHLDSDGVVVIQPQRLVNNIHKGRNRGMSGRRLPTRGVRRGTLLQLVDSTPTACTLQLQDPDVPRARKFARLTARQTYNCAQCNSTLLTGTDYFKDEGRDLFDPANRWCAECVGQSAPKKPEPEPESSPSASQPQQKRFVAPYLAHASESTIQRDFAEKAQEVQLEKAYETNEQKQKRLEARAAQKAELKVTRVDESERVRCGYEAKIEEEMVEKVNEHLQEDMLTKAKAVVLEISPERAARRNPQPSMSAQVLADVQRANSLGSVGTDGLTSVRRWIELKEEQVHEKVAARVVKELKKEGVMYKKGGKKNTKRWQQRTFKLDRGYLRYYKIDKTGKDDKKNKDGPPQQYLAEFQLNRECRLEVTQDKKKGFPFILRTPARTYKLACDTEEERISWIDAISVVAFYMQRESAMIESAQESKHEFQLFHFDRPTWCDYCGKFVWGVVGKFFLLNLLQSSHCISNPNSQKASKPTCAETATTLPTKSVLPMYQINVPQNLETSETFCLLDDSLETCRLLATRTTFLILKY